jgi:integrase
MPKLTKRFIDSVQPDPKRDLFFWDDDLKCFGLRVKPSGHRSYIVQYRNAHGTSRRQTVGQHGRLTPDEARKEARRILADVDRGLDPVAQKEALRNAPTISDLADRYMREHAEVKKKASSVRSDRQLWQTHILPALGKRKVAEVTRADVASLHNSIGGKARGAANRTLSLLSKSFNLAEVWGWREDGTNPCRHIGRFQERKLERFLSEEELNRLGQTLAQAEEEGTELPGVILAIRLLILTGCRLGEILNLTWDEVDFNGKALRLSDSKTGKKNVPLGTFALELLADSPRLEGNGYVVPGRKIGEHLVNLEKPWRRIRSRAGLHDVRLHDLRHSFASVAVGAGFTLPIIGAILGHRQTATTSRYAHLANDPLQLAADSISGKIASSLSAGRKADTSIPLEN